MQLTKDIIKLKNILIKIPKATKRIWDLSENRCGYRKCNYQIILV